MREKRARATELRLTGRLSNSEIASRVDVDKSTVSRWLSVNPLTPEERREKQLTSAKSRRCREGETSKHWSNSDTSSMTRLQKGKIAEAAIVFRCVLHGFNVYLSPFDGDTADLLVEVPGTPRAVRVQVKLCKRASTGSPSIRLTSLGRNNIVRRAKKGDFDFLIGYDLKTDSAYVFSWGETEHLREKVAIRDEALEAWHKLKS